MTKDNTENLPNPNAPVENQTPKENDTQKEAVVPLKTFLEEKAKLKALKEENEGYKSRDKKIEEDKLLEDKKYQDLITSKDKDLQDTKLLLEKERRENKLEKIKTKFSNELSKANAIDAEDALKFISYEDLLDSDNIESELKSRVENLVSKKAYLFKTVPGKNNENGKPVAPTSNNTNNSKIDPMILSLAQKFNKI